MRSKPITGALAVLAAAALVGACSPTAGGPGASEPEAIFLEPEDGATVGSPFEVRMAASNVEIAPAGEIQPGEGHFHIMIDEPCVDDGETIPSDDQHLHYGDGSTEDELDLEPGEYTLCLQLGDGEHTAIGIPDEIAITVE